MVERNKEQIEEYNKSIVEAVLISQMMETKGFAVFEKFLKDKEKEFRFQDIFRLDEENLSEQRGMAVMINSIIGYFEKQKLLAEKPRIDPETGKPEILNNKKNN